MFITKDVYTEAAKLCNNLVLGITMAAVCEGHALADRFGLDQKKLAEILNMSSGRCCRRKSKSF